MTTIFVGGKSEIQVGLRYLEKEGERMSSGYNLIIRLGCVRDRG